MPTVQPSRRWSDSASVVVEHGDWETGLSYAAALRDAGFAVLVCPGPDARGLTGRCPILSGGECSLVSGAEVVVSALGRTAAGHEIAEQVEQRGHPCVVLGDDPAPAPRAVVRAVKAAVAR